MFGPTYYRTWQQQLGPVAASLTLLLTIWMTGPSLGQDSPAAESPKDSVISSPSAAIVYDADRELLIAGVYDDLEDAPRAVGPRLIQKFTTDGQAASAEDVDDIERELMVGKSDLETP